MDLPISNVGFALFYSTSFLEKVEAVIDANVDERVSDVALFITRLIKGLQNLSNSDSEVAASWGEYLYDIEDVGVVSFRLLFDEATGEKVLAIENVRWAFSTSRFFSGFVY